MTESATVSLHVCVLVFMEIVRIGNVTGFIDSPFDTTVYPGGSRITTAPPTTRSPTTSASVTNPPAHPDDIDSQLDAILTRVQALEQENADLKAELAGMKTALASVPALESRLSSLEKEYTTVAAETTKVQDDVTSLSAMKYDITTIQRSFSTLQGEVNDLKGSVNSVSSTYTQNIATLDNKVSTLSANFDNLRQLVSNDTTSGSFVTNSPHVQYSTIMPFVPVTPFSGNNGSNPRDCLEVFVTNSNPGVYVIQPDQSPTSFHVYCDRGWTIIQRRIDGMIQFSSPYKKWDDFLGGFGNTSGEYWLGNEHVHWLTKQGNYTLRIEAEGYSMKKYWAQFTSFIIADEIHNFRCNVTGFTGNYHDPMESANGQAFATMDIPNGVQWFGDCETVLAGGWWVDVNEKYCGYNLNMPYDQSAPCMNFAGRCVKTSVMKIIPSGAVRP